MQKDSLVHHGIKGQRWGIRRYQNSDGSLTAAGKNRYSTDGGSSQSASSSTSGNSNSSSTSSSSTDRSKWSTSKKSIQNLSDDELKSRINRLNLEIQYKQKMNTIDADKVRGETFVKNTGEAIMGKLLKDTGVSVGGYLINTLAESMGYEGKVVDVSLSKKKDSNNDSSKKK